MPTFDGSEIVSCPPYCGAPSLSHQCAVEPVVVVVDVVFDGVVAGVVLETIVVTEVVDVVVWGGVDADVAVEHEAKSIDANSKQVNPVQIAFLFIHSSFVFSSR